MLPRVEMTPREFEPAKLLREPVKSDPSFQKFSEPGVFCVAGVPKIIYGKMDCDLTPALAAISSIKFMQEVRTIHTSAISSKHRVKQGKAAGLGESRIFGFRPPVGYAANYCGPCSATLEFPKQFKALVELGNQVAAKYKAICPDEFARQELLAREVRPEWRIPGTPFTSGIVNRNNSLRYHYDKGNIEDCMSCMIVFRKDCQGGMLSVPEFGAEFLLEDGAFFFFDGQKILHGVTPMYVGSFGYRYSVVFYALKKMMECGTLEQELQRARTSKTRTQKKRV